MKISIERELQQIATNHSSDIEFKNFMKLHQNFIKESFSFLINDTTADLEKSII